MKVIKQPSTFQIYANHNEDSYYPEMLLKALSNENIMQRQIQQGIYLFDQWVEDYQQMNVIQQSKYGSYNKKIMKELAHLHRLGRTPFNGLSAYYFLFYETANDITNLLSSGISNSQYSQLNLLRKICFSLMNRPKSISSIAKFSSFISSRFQKLLRNYKWRIHEEKIYILQICRFLNVWNISEQFQHHGDEWVKIMKEMRENIKLEEGKVNVEQNCIELSPFIEVNDEQQQLNYFKAAIQKQIIQCRCLLKVVDENFWNQIGMAIVSRVEDGLSTYQADNPVHQLILSTFMNMLKFDKIKELIEQNCHYYIQRIILPFSCKQNLPTSLLKREPYDKLPLIFKDIILTLDPQKKNLQIRQNYLAFINAISRFVDDHQSRHFLDACCIDDFEFKASEIEDMMKIISSSHLKKTMGLETFRVLVKVLKAGVNRSEVNQLTFVRLLKNVDEIVKEKQDDANINIFREEINQLYVRLLSKIEIKDKPSKTLDHLMEWLYNVQKNSKYYTPVILNILQLVLNKYPQAMREMDYTNMSKVLDQRCLKMQGVKNQNCIFTLLNCITTAYLKINWTHMPKKLQKLCPANSHELAHLRKQCLLLIKHKEKENIKIDSSPKHGGIKFIEENNNIIEETQRGIIGEDDLKSIGELIRTLEKGEVKNPLIYSEIVWLEAMFTTAVLKVQPLLKPNEPNNFFEEILEQIDSDLHFLFLHLESNGGFQLIFIIACKFFLHSRNYQLIKSLDSYQFIRENCFDILSRHYNKTLIMGATSFFSTILLSFATCPERLVEVYEDLNTDDFLTDLFKGCDQFIGKVNHYDLGVLEIILAFWMTEQLRQSDKQLNEDLSNLNKNVQWWIDSKTPINIQVQQIDSNYVLESFKSFYQDKVEEYFAQIIKTIQSRKKNKSFS